MSRLDRVLFPFLLLAAVGWLASKFGAPIPKADFFGFLLLFLGIPYAVIRIIGWARRRLLWSLRNRLIVAYVFIAVVPVLLLVVMAWLTADMLYTQVGIYLLHQEMESRIRRVSWHAETAVSVVAGAPSQTAGRVSRPGVMPSHHQGIVSRLQNEFPGASVEILRGAEAELPRGKFTTSPFSGLVQTGDELWIRAVAWRESPTGPVGVSVSVPVTGDLLDGFDTSIGTLQLILTRPATAQDGNKAVLPFGDAQLVSSRQIVPRRRPVVTRKTPLDFAVQGFAQFEAIEKIGAEVAGKSNPIFAPFATRTSALNRQFFTALGSNRIVGFSFLILAGLVFLLIEVGALFVGIRLTRTITVAVNELSLATQTVQSGDLTYRVRLPLKDQLGALGESFNEMTGSIAGLIEEQKQRQRLEGELAIAQEVQSQLFPQSLPQMPGIQLAAVCRAARVVSGDFYDFVRLGPNLLCMVVADISGKGISAAILMASLQAALRVQTLGDVEVASNPAELVTRLNRHLYLNTSEERYATLFYAVLDTDTRLLRYTNAGHLPPLYVVGDRAQRLDQGGTVVGLIDDCLYEQGVVEVEPGGMLVAYSDGLIEPENVFGQEFGVKRLEEEVLRHRGAAPRRLAESLVARVEEWGGSPEPADDMTVIIVQID